MGLLLCTACHWTVGRSPFWFLTHPFEVPNYPTIKMGHLGCQTAPKVPQSIGIWIPSASSAGFSALWGWWSPNFPGLFLVVWPLHVGHCGVAEMEGDWWVVIFRLTSLSNFCCSIVRVVTSAHILVWLSMLGSPITIWPATMSLELSIRWPKSFIFKQVTVNSQDFVRVRSLTMKCVINSPPSVP